jgi:GNAT superfamily N-acetyltransferase
MVLERARSHQLNSSQVDEIAQLLALAFEKGSGLSQICSAGDEKLLRRLYVLFRAGLVLQASARREVLSVAKRDRIVGVAIVQEPESHFPLWAKIHWLLQVSFGISPIVAWHLWQSLRTLERYHPCEPHHYLMLLGVHPSFQGQGYARTLLEVLHARSAAHPTSVGVYLETANPSNLAFYQYFGYHLRTKVNINEVENFILFRSNPPK